MPQPRTSQISLSDTPYYHCISRCVRRAFLCGNDAYTGTNYDHRREWIADKIKELGQVFAIDICAYAVMSNHYHVVLKVNQKQAQNWTDEEVIARWTSLFAPSQTIQDYLLGRELTKAEEILVKQQTAEWRTRLFDISWFMRYLNEHIARQANKEDQVKGRFWEGRFKSQALLDEAAILSCMAYVDLNPIRAKLADTPEDSAFTSIYERIKQYKKDQSQAKNLKPFTQSEEDDGLPFTLKDYLELVDWTGRIIKHNKRGTIPEHAPPILNRLNLSAENYIQFIHKNRFVHAVGTVANLKKWAKSTGLQFVKGYQQATQMFFEPVPKTSIAQTSLE
jgi:REP element-mobilizing transposase RayT